MSTNLVHRGSSWIVVYNTANHVVNEKFDTIELAADFMMNKLKVKDEDIDQALIVMYTMDKVRSIFNSEGEFIGSDVQ